MIDKKYCSMERSPFFDIAAKYLPKNNSKYLLDIGAGTGAFAEYLELHKYPNMFLLDSNPKTIATLKEKQFNALLYKAPNRLPFEDSSVSYIHCSHMIEHLYHEELHKFLNEINRITAPEAHVIISAPMLWELFYEDLSHVKPYNPSVVINYLCADYANRSNASISNSFKNIELIYRYISYPVLNTIHSENLTVNWILHKIKKMCHYLKIKSYHKNGFTLVLKKS